MTPQLKVCNCCGSLHQDYRSPVCDACARTRPQRPASRNKRRRTDHAKAGDKIYGDPRWAKVRALALQRDSYRCIRCGTTQQLVVHHDIEWTEGIDPYDLDNLETLCRRCHGQLHAHRRARTQARTQRGG